MSREAVLLQWERKIEVAERLDAGERVEPGDRRDPDDRAVDDRRVPHGRRFARTEDAHEGGRRFAPTEDEAPEDSGQNDSAEAAEPVPLHAVEDAPAPRRFVHAPYEGGTQSPSQPVAERRTITITGQPTPARRRRAVVDSQLAQPDRVALWAFLLGLLLVAVAAGTAHA